MSEQQIIGVDLFSGAGGMTLGAIRAGIKVVYAVEQCPYASATYKLNFPDVTMHHGDIREVKHLPTKPRGVRTILFGGPPCQGFSTSNQRTRHSHNPKNWLFLEFVRLVRVWSPDWVVMENVKGLTETEGGRFLNEAILSLEGAGYKVGFKLLNSVDFGVPQRRTRAFIVGSKADTHYRYPVPLNTKPVCVDDAIRDLPSLANGSMSDKLAYGNDKPSEYAAELRGGNSTVTGNLVTKNAEHILERYRHVPPGGNWENVPEGLFSNYKNRSRCHTGIYRRLDPFQPSVVIGNFRKNMLIHPFEDRGLSVREAARIQAVPDQFCFAGSIGFQQQQVGNMVPPALAFNVFAAISARMESP